MATINIDGRTFSGNSISIVGGVVKVDGKVQDGVLSGVVEIRIVEGVLGNLTTDSSVVCGAVQGNVAAGGSVTAERVSGNISAGGSVDCVVAGKAINAGGSVRVGR